MFHKSIEYQTYAFTEDGPTSLSINGPKLTMCQHRTSKGGMSPLYSCKLEMNQVEQKFVWNNLGMLYKLEMNLGKQKFMWNNLGMLYKLRDEPGQAEICVEQPGDAVQVKR